MQDLFAMNFTTNQINAVSNLGLAHVGDAVFELLCRSYLCSKGDSTVKKLHHDAVSLVKAQAQAKFAEKMLPHLTEAELSYYRRGKNTHTHAAPKSASPKEYAMATGLETMFGALYLAGEQQRINALFWAVMEELYGV